MYRKIRNIISLFLLPVILLTGCYSFTGGSVPPHLKTIYIATVKDNSGYGNPVYKQTLTQLLIDRFRNDNSFKVVDVGGDARLEVSIAGINDQPQTISTGTSGTLENERKITVNCSVKYYDAVKKKEIWNKRVSNYNIYDLANAQQARNEAVEEVLEQLSDDIVLAVVSGW